MACEWQVADSEGSGGGESVQNKEEKRIERTEKEVKEGENMEESGVEKTEGGRVEGGEKGRRDRLKEKKKMD